MLSAAYASIDIFLHISAIGESFGMVLAESLLCETPVITHATPWADNSQGEVIGHEIGGFVATTPNKLFQCCRKLAFDNQLRLRLGKAGARYVASQYDSVHVSSTVVQMIQDRGHELHPCSPAVEAANIERESYGFLTRLLFASPHLKKYEIYSTGFSPLCPALFSKSIQVLGSAKALLTSARFRAS